MIYFERTRSKVTKEESGEASYDRSKNSRARGLGAGGGGYFAHVVE